MSKQLLLSASLSVLMMVGFVLSGVEFAAPHVVPAIGEMVLVKAAL